jgi:hypothetical protein
MIAPVVSSQLSEGLRQPLARRGVTWRALLLAAVLIPINVTWDSYTLIWGQSHPATVSLFYNVVFTLLALNCLNLLLRRWAPRLALTSGELVVIYAMVSISTAICGLDLMQVLVPVMAHPFYFATPENRWEDLFLRGMPGWLAVSDLPALERLHDGDSTLFVRANLGAWWRPMLAWGGFVFVLLFVMLCINALVRKQWTEDAKLSFPIAELPLQLTDVSGTLFRRKLMWAGFALAAIYDTLNGLHYLFPQVPNVGGELYDLGQQIRTAPWNAIGWTPLGVFPFAVGLAFFIPLDLAFSCWFFYVFWKVQRIASGAVGFGIVPSAPFINEQCFAAYLTLAAFALWATRRHLQRVLADAWHGRRSQIDAREPLPYTVALAGIAGGLLVLTLFCVAAKAAWLPSLIFFVLYFGISTGIDRIRAELGSPVHDLHFSGPDTMMLQAAGTLPFSKPTLSLFAFFFSFNRAHRSHAMPHQLEAMKLAERRRVDYRALSWALLLAALLGVVCGLVIQTDVFYRYGIGGSTGKGTQAFSRLQTWLSAPGGINWYASLAMLAGAAMTVFLTYMRTRLVWWPFHPAGFAVSGSWSMALLCPSIFVGWLLKAVLLRYGGMTSFRPAASFFHGLILGAFTMGSFWSILGLALKRRMYNFLP